MKKRIYLDYAATTPVDPRALKKMLPFFSEKFGNSMSLHEEGRKAQEVLEKSRAVLAAALNAEPREIIFTSSASESNNLALKGLAFKSGKKHLIVSSIEHHCVLESAKWLEGRGFKVTYLPVDKYGLVSPEDVRKAITKETFLVSVIFASNEIGTIEPIEEIAFICKEKGVYFHTDASQAFGKMKIDVRKMNIDLLTASSQKIYGPKGVALLYLRSGISLEPLISGGGQERGLRSSTVNVPAIIGFSEAARICNLSKEEKRISGLRDFLIKEITTKIKDAYLTGHPKKRISNSASFRFDFIEGESLVFLLDQSGISVSTGSACSSSSLEPSHVLMATGLKPQEAHGSLRISLGRWTRKEDLVYAVKEIIKAVESLRKISPFKNVH